MKLLSIDIDHLSDNTRNLLVRDKHTPPSILDKIAKTYKKEVAIIKLIIKNPSTPLETIAFLSQYSTDEIKEYIKFESQPASSHELKITEEEEKIERTLIEKEKQKESKDRAMNLSMRIQRMNVSEKIQLALKGNKEMRTILIRDTNKDVVLSVIDNPRLTETEVELIAQSRNVPEEALRTISKNREWMKNYGTMHSLVNNPKTPIGISISLLGNLKTKDLISIEKSKGIASVLRVAAKRLLTQRMAK